MKRMARAAAVLGLTAVLTGSAAGARGAAASEQAIDHKPASPAATTAFTSVELRNIAAQTAADQVGVTAAADLAGQYAGLAITASGGLQVSLVGAPSAAFRARMLSAAGSVPVSYRLVAHSLRTLASVTQAMTRDTGWWAGRGIGLAAWGPDYASDEVSVSLTRYTPAAAAAITRRYGSSLVRVETVSAPAPSLSGRYNDVPPWFGGDYLTLVGKFGARAHCSSGFNVQDSNGADFVLTAGHCAPNGTRAYVGRRFVGIVGHNDFPAVDAELIPGLSASLIWSSTVNSAAVHDVTAVAKVDLIGGLICTDGAVTGEVCAVRIIHVGWCFHEPFTDINVCGLVVADRPGTKVNDLGDSGGPVETTFPNGATEARGQIVAGSNTGTTAGTFNTVWYEPIGTITSHFHVHVLEGSG